ncbi:hypothetical protein CRYUN_Cryun29cG0003000 [Craigia yunnanensis]
MESYIEDTEKYLGMPVIFSEFGVSAMDPGYNSSFRDTVISTVYKTLLNSTKKEVGLEASCGSCSLMEQTTWMMAMQLSLQSLAMFNSMCSWKCRWGCKKKNALETFLYHDDL